MDHNQTPPWQTFQGFTDSNHTEPHVNHVYEQFHRKAQSIWDLPFVRNLREKDDLVQALEILKDFDHADTLVVLGTGGSTLGAQALIQGFNGVKELKSKSVIFWDNIDPLTLKDHILSLQTQNFCVLAISKSGNTTETVAQLHWLLGNFPYLHQSKKVAIITQLDPIGSPLSAIRDLALNHQFFIIDHPGNIGGRFSCLSVVGLLPLWFRYRLSLEDLIALRNSAYQVVQHFLTLDFKFLYNQVVLMDRYFHQHKNQHVMMIYGDTFKGLGLWWAQLWAESLGKTCRNKNFGMTPILAQGTLDQHSQLQFYLDGPKDKIFTMIYATQDCIMNVANYVDCYTNPLNKLLSSITPARLFESHYHATRTTLQQREIPVREIKVNTIIRSSVPATMMYFFLETIMLGWFWDIDPFDQPAVEQGKVLVAEDLRIYLHKINYPS